MSRGFCADGQTPVILSEAKDLVLSLTPQINRMAVPTSYMDPPVKQEKKRY
jgi:hypothetical protein